MHDEAAKHKDCFQNVEFANSVDFICNMQLSLGISDTAHYKGKVYGFCYKPRIRIRNLLQRKIASNASIYSFVLLVITLLLLRKKVLRGRLILLHFFFS